MVTKKRSFFSILSLVFKRKKVYIAGFFVACITLSTILIFVLAPRTSESYVTFAKNDYFRQSDYQTFRDTVTGNETIETTTKQLASKGIKHSDGRTITFVDISNGLSFSAIKSSSVSYSVYYSSTDASVVVDILNELSSVTLKTLKSDPSFKSLLIVSSAPPAQRTFKIVNTIKLCLFLAIVVSISGALLIELLDHTIYDGQEYLLCSNKRVCKSEKRKKAYEKNIQKIIDTIEHKNGNSIVRIISPNDIYAGRILADKLARKYDSMGNSSLILELERLKKEAGSPVAESFLIEKMASLDGNNTAFSFHKDMTKGEVIPKKLLSDKEILEKIERKKESYDRIFIVSKSFFIEDEEDEFIKQCSLIAIRSNKTKIEDVSSTLYYMKKHKLELLDVVSVK